MPRLSFVAHGIPALQRHLEIGIGGDPLGGVTSPGGSATGLIGFPGVTGSLGVAGSSGTAGSPGVEGLAGGAVSLGLQQFSQHLSQPSQGSFAGVEGSGFFGLMGF